MSLSVSVSNRLLYQSHYSPLIEKHSDLVQYGTHISSKVEKKPPLKDRVKKTASRALGILGEGFMYFSRSMSSLPPLVPLVVTPLQFQRKN